MPPSLHRAEGRPRGNSSPPIRARRSPRPTTWCSTAGKWGGGSVRIHREEVQSKVFLALGIGAEEARNQIWFSCWMPCNTARRRTAALPSASIVWWTMMTGAESIRDVIAFPKTQRAQDLLVQAPSEVDEKQLRELHIRLRKPEKQKPDTRGRKRPHRQDPVTQYQKSRTHRGRLHDCRHPHHQSPAFTTSIAR